MGQLMRGVIRTILTVVLAAGLWGAGTSMAPTAKADVEMLMVPSAAMGRDIPVAFSGGGPHAVVLLDAFNAAPDVSNWVTAGNAMATLGGQGISVAAPAGGAWSMYTNWEQDGSKQWETFLATELPNWLAANKGLAPGGHGIVGASQGGYGAMAMATFHPDRYRFAGSLSGFLAPERTGTDGAITAGLQQFGGVDTRNMWGLPQLGRWKWHSPNVHVQLLSDNNTRLWVYSPTTGGLRRARDDRLLRSSPQARTRSSTSTTAPSAAPTATSTSQQAAAMTGAPGADSSPRCRANWSPRSSSQRSAA